MYAQTYIFRKPYRLLCFFIHHSQIKTKLLKDIAKNKNKGSKRDPCGTTALGTSHPEVCSLRVTLQSHHFAIS